MSLELALGEFFEKNISKKDGRSQNTFLQISTKNGTKKDSPHWFSEGKLAFQTVIPYAERVFALVKNLFGDQQLSALKDYIQAALKLNYHGRVVG